MKFVLATQNPKKLKEMSAILGELGVEVVSEADLGVKIEVEETGETFAENSLLKAKAVMEAKAGKVEYRLDKTNIIHCPIGKVSFGADKLFENYSALIGAIIKAKPAAAKGQYIKSCVAASTMGPGVKMNANKQL